MFLIIKKPFFLFFLIKLQGLECIHSHEYAQNECTRDLSIHQYQGKRLISLQMNTLESLCVYQCRKNDHFIHPKNGRKSIHTSKTQFLHYQTRPQSKAHIVTTITFLGIFLLFFLFLYQNQKIKFIEVVFINALQHVFFINNAIPPTIPVKILRTFKYGFSIFKFSI